MAFNYLKKHLQTNVPVIVTLVKRYSPTPEKDFTTKELTGKNQYPYDFAVGNEIMKHYATEREEQSLSLFKEEDKLQVVRQEQVKPDGKRIFFNVWTTVDGVEATAAANPPLRSNVAQKTYEKNQEERVDNERARQMSIILQAFTKSWIEGGIAKTPEDACKLAMETYLIHRVDVARLLND